MVTTAAAATPLTFVVMETQRPDRTTTHEAWSGSPTVSAYGAPSEIYVSAGLRSVGMASADGSPLTVGIYVGATSGGQGGTPRLSVNGSVTGECGQLSTFEILQAPTYVDSVVTSFAATFERRCTDPDSVVHGTIAIGTDLPLGALDMNVTGLTFDDGIVAEVSDPMAVVLSNIGAIPVTIGTVATQGPDAASFVVSDDCGVLEAGASCTVQVRMRAMYDRRLDAAVGIESDLDLVPRVVTLTGTAFYVEGVNSSLASATVIDALPFLDGKQIPFSGTTSQACPNAAATIWYRYASSTRRVVYLDTGTSQSTPTILGLYSGPPSNSTRLACGVATSSPPRDTLTFTAEANTTYYIAVSGSGYSTPYRVVLQASEGPPDTVVLASGFARQSATFYPYKDSYLDTLRISGVRGEKASARIVVYDSANKAVRGWDVPSGLGAYSVTWDGKRSSGATVPVGKYRIVQTVTDVWGNKLAHTSYVYTSSKRLYTYTYSTTRDAGSYAAAGKVGTGSYSRTASDYAGGVRLSSGSSGAASVAYTFSIPSATIYKSIKFQVLGDGLMGGSVIGLQDWTECSAFNDGCVYAWGDGPISYGWATVAGGASKNVSTGRAIRGYVRAPGFGRTGWIDARDVKLTVVYGILK